jgi:CPA1 family monovalent cation:H+ antiporter
LTMIIEGESLFNDGTAVVLFQLVLVAVTSGGQWSLPLTAGSFFGIVFGGAALGALLGYIASCVTSAFDDHLLEITLTMVTAYGAFLIADHLKVSAVMAVVAAGIVIGNYGSRTGMSATTRLAVNSFWEYAAFLVNSLLFILIGLQVKWQLLVQYRSLIGFGVLAVVVARLIVIYGICPFISTKQLPIPMKWRHLLFWGGLRGALVMALALSLPLGYPDRDEIINMTFGVVLFTLLVPGLTMDPLIKLLGMAPTQKNLSVFHERTALLSAYQFELQALDQLQQTGQISPATFQSISSDLNYRVATIDHNLEEMKKKAHSVDETELSSTRVRLMKQRKERLRDLAKEGVLDESALHKLIVSVDVELDMFVNAAAPDDPPA